MPRKGMSVTADKVFSLAREGMTLSRILLLDMYYGLRGSRGSTTYQVPCPLPNILPLLFSPSCNGPLVSTAETSFTKFGVLVMLKTPGM